jgi:hypothetical protein
MKWCAEHLMLRHTQKRQPVSPATQDRAACLMRTERPGQGSGPIRACRNLQSGSRRSRSPWCDLTIDLTASASPAADLTSALSDSQTATRKMVFLSAGPIRHQTKKRLTAIRRKPFVFPLLNKRGRRDSNPQPPDRQSGTLTN